MQHRCMHRPRAAAGRRGTHLRCHIAVDSKRLAAAARRLSAAAQPQRCAGGNRTHGRRPHPWGGARAQAPAARAGAPQPGSEHRQPRSCRHLACRLCAAMQNPLQQEGGQQGSVVQPHGGLRRAVHGGGQRGGRALGMGRRRGRAAVRRRSVPRDAREDRRARSVWRARRHGRLRRMPLGGGSGGRRAVDLGRRRTRQARHRRRGGLHTPPTQSTAPPAAYIFPPATPPLSGAGAVFRCGRRPRGWHPRCLGARRS